jgi:CubicO group peptidase (beta-lactamase class C family)
MIIRTLTISLAALALVTTAHAAPLDPAKVDAAVKSAMDANGTPSAQVAVVQDGKIVFSKAYGDAQLSPALAATTATRYEIASVSKEFTAAAALLLVEDGKLSLDDHVSKWFPDLTGADQITVRQLLSHTAGVSDFWPQDYVMLPVTKPTTPMAVMNDWAKKPLDFKPGEDWQYSNTGYIVAGEIIEKVSGQPLFAFVNDRLLKPVGIQDAIDISAEHLKAPDAVGYERRALAPNRLTLPGGAGWFYGSAYLGLTAEDVAKWDISFLKKSLLKPASYATEVTTIKLNNGRDTGYAMGLFVSKPNGHTMIEHDGEGAGFLSENRIYPDDGIAIVVLTNTMSGGTMIEAADRIAYMMLPQQGTDAHLRQVFEGLQAGRIDRADFTDNCNGYMTDATVAEFKSSLGALGEPGTFSLSRTALRGGMEYRGYRIRAGRKTLSLSVYMTKDGKIEQFLVGEVN